MQVVSTAFHYNHTELTDYAAILLNLTAAAFFLFYFNKTTLVAFGWIKIYETAQYLQYKFTSVQCDAQNSGHVDFYFSQHSKCALLCIFELTLTFLDAKVQLLVRTNSQGSITWQQLSAFRHVDVVRPAEVHSEYQNGAARGSVHRLPSGDLQRLTL